VPAWLVVRAALGCRRATLAEPSASEPPFAKLDSGGATPAPATQHPPLALRVPGPPGRLASNADP